jgi:hypothetical protein
MIKYSDEIKGMNLWEKVANISAEIGNLQKDDVVGTGSKSQYKAISIEKVVKSVGEKMNKYGVVIYPIQQQYTRTDERVMGYDSYNKKDVEKINRISDVDVTYQVVNIHNPVETMITVASGTGVDTQDKGVGKAQTYAYKNMLLKLFAIATGDDTDKIHSDDYTNKLYGEKPKDTINADLREKLYDLAKRKGITQASINKSCTNDYNSELNYLDAKQYEELFARISKVKDKE